MNTAFYHYLLNTEYTQQFEVVRAQINAFHYLCGASAAEHQLEHVIKISYDARWLALRIWFGGPLGHTEV